MPKYLTLKELVKLNENYDSKTKKIYDIEDLILTLNDYYIPAAKLEQYNLAIQIIDSYFEGQGFFPKLFAKLIYPLIKLGDTQFSIAIMKEIFREDRKTSKNSVGISMELNSIEPGITQELVKEVNNA